MTGQECSGDLIVERHGHVLLLQLNRPDQHNALGGTLMRDLGEAFTEAAQDDDIHVAVTTGRGRAFSVGADVGDLDAGFAASAREIGVQSAKALLRRSVEGTLVEQLKAEQSAQVMLFDHPQTHAAMAALAERLGRRSGARA